MKVLSASSLVLGALLALLGTGTARGETRVWWRNTDKSTVNSGEGVHALTNLAYWVDADGTVGEGPVTADDELIFVGTRLRHNLGGTFAGKSLQIGDDKAADVCHDGSTPTFGNDGLKLKYGCWFFNSARNLGFKGKVTILAEKYPFVFHYGQAKYGGYTGTIDAQFSGGENAKVVFGPYNTKFGNTTPTCATNTTFVLTDISAYSGLITVSSKYENVGTDFGTLLNVATSQCAARLEIGHGGGLATRTASDLLQVRDLKFDPGSRLVVTIQQENPAAAGLIRATNSLALSGRLPIFFNSVVRERGLQRLPILSWPSTQAQQFTEDDFELIKGPTFYNLDLHFEVAEDTSMPGYTALYLVTYGFVIQNKSYSDEGTRDGSHPSSLTNDVAWWGEKAPSPEPLAAYRSALQLRTLEGTALDYDFPGVLYWQEGGGFHHACRTFTVPEFYAGPVFENSSAAVLICGSKVGAKTATIRANHFHFINGTIHFRWFAAHTGILDGEIDGPATLLFEGWSGTGSPEGKYKLPGLNTNFTGRILVDQLERRDDYLNFDTHYQTLYVSDGRNLGGRRPEPDPRALTLKRYSMLNVEKDGVVLEEGLNRGLYVQGCGRVFVGASKSAKYECEIRWPVLLSGAFWKQGEGSLVLAGPMRHETDDDGEVCDVPRAGSNLVVVAAGTLKIAHADALAGAETSFSDGTKLVVRYTGEDDDLQRYGIRDTTATTPFAGALPIELDVSRLPVPTGVDAPTLGLVTVSRAAADDVEALLPKTMRLWKGYASKVVREDGAETTTFKVKSEIKGLMLIVR